MPDRLLRSRSRAQHSRCNRKLLPKSLPGHIQSLHRPLLQPRLQAHLLLYTHLMQAQYVQFGCGTCAPETWRNFDAGPAFLLEKRLPFLKPVLLRKGFPDYPNSIEYGDVIKGLPVAPGSVRAVYCSHVLEHLSLEDCRRTLRNVFSYLQPGGIFRLVVPDLEHLTRTYLEAGDGSAAHTFMVEAHLGETTTERGLRSLPRALFGRSQHLWMWDYKSMSAELAAAGFTAIRRARCGDSDDPQFLHVEDEGRWRDALGIECRRP